MTEDAQSQKDEPEFVHRHGYGINRDPVYGRKALAKATAWLMNLPREERIKVMLKHLRRNDG